MTISPQARKQVEGVIADLDKIAFEGAFEVKDLSTLASALLLSMSIERAAMMQIRAAEKLAKEIEIMRMQGGPQILKL